MNSYRRLLCIILALAMVFSLTGCFFAGDTDDDDDDGKAVSINPADSRKGLVSFTEIEYERPNIDDISDSADKVCELVDKGKVNVKLGLAIDDFQTLYNHYLTMSEVAMIRSELDRSDSYYSEESAWCSERSAEVERILNDLLEHCANSDICDELDERYFDGLLNETFSDDGYLEYTDRIVELKEQESKLLTECDELSTQMLYVDIDETDRWDEFNEEAAEIYIDLIKVRRSIAEEWGYDSYMEMAYEDFGRDYSAEDLEDYTEAIKEYITPVYYDALYSGKFYSMFNVGSMRPERSFRYVEDCLTELDPTLKECMRFMKKYDLYDISDSVDKISSSYTTYLQDYASPYLFVSPECSKADILTIAHEFGHFCDKYINYDGYYSLDTMEMLSQGMEYMLISHLEDDELSKELSDYKLADVLALYVDQGCYSEFEHRAYSLPDSELTVDNINALFAEVADEYGFSIGYYPEYLNYIWIQVPHMFQYPFYIISYCVSDSAAFNLYMMELENEGSGFEAYMKLLDDCDTADFLDLIEEHDLPSPISADTVMNIADIIEDELNAA